MAPPCRTFTASDLESEVQSDLTGRKRKTEGGKNIDLARCELFSMLQYDCQIDHPERRNSPVRCWPVPRMFRRCQDKKGVFMVETTKWETGNAGSITSPSPDEKLTGTGEEVRQWTTHSWKERKVSQSGQYHDR